MRRTGTGASDFLDITGATAAPHEPAALVDGDQATVSLVFFASNRHSRG
ncbi:hypothetical protein [Streptomyces nojiriensis]